MLSQPFTTSGLTEIEKNADLALYLLDLLTLRRDPDERIWRGERHVRTLQATSHVVEALHQLGLSGLTEDLIEPATYWLTHLPLGRDLALEESRALRIYPSRFKTLALLGRFTASGLGPDFAELTHLLNPVTGWIWNAPLDLSPTLVTLIWADTVQSLNDPGLVEQSQWKKTLNAISIAFEAWATQASTALHQAEPLPDGQGQRPGEIANSGDASYAFDLLLRTGRLAPTSPRALEVREVLTAAIRQHRLGDLRRSDLLYVGLHLRAHFPDHPDSQRAVEDFVLEIRERYASHEAAREPVPFHALVLRLLMAHHGALLPQAVLHKLWQTNRTLAQAQQQEAQQALEYEFSNLVRQSIHIHLGPPHRLTGTRARGEVYRVRFGLTTEATDERGVQLSAPSNTLRLIIKKGPPEILTRAIERYHHLPEPLQRLFARHTRLDPQRATAGYLVMQDLADMLPLSEALQPLDKLAGHERQAQASQAAQIIAHLLRALHGYERAPAIISHAQFTFTYLAPMVRSLNHLSQPGAFPELKQWLEGPLEVNGWAYKRPEWYFKQLARYELRLRPPTLSYIHGDCHSRNLMLTHTFGQARFVDIDTLTSGEDYLLDYGLLLEDLLVYQALPYADEPGQIPWDAIQTRRPASTATTLENWIAYPAFPGHAEAARWFQRELLGQARRYAEEIEDPYWQQRLWLAIARGLLLLASRQLVSQAIEPRRRAEPQKLINDLKLVQVAYAESLRLLHELNEHLESKETLPLPALPFPGEHRPASRPASLTGNEIAALLEAITHEWGEAVGRQSPPATPYFIDYETRPNRQVFARIHTKTNASSLYLPYAPEQLDDPHHLVQPTTEGHWPARIALAPNTPLPAVLLLVKQAYHLAAGGPVH